MLLNLKLPKIDRLEILRQIKTDKTLTLIPVVALTLSDDEKFGLQLQFGVNACALTRVDFQWFVNAIKGAGRFLGDD
jgi:two-component system, response regulator